MRISKSDFTEMVFDYLADNADEMEGIIIDSTEKINGEWVAYAHDSEGIYLLREYDGTGNIRIEYEGTGNIRIEYEGTH